MEEFHFSYSEFKNNASETFGDFWKEKDFVNVTLVSSDEVNISAHKVILASASPVLKRALVKNPHEHPLMFFNGIRSSVLERLIKFIYLGECSVEQDDLVSFLDAGKGLQIRGLADELDEPQQKPDPGDSFQRKKSKDSHALEQFVVDNNGHLDDNSQLDPEDNINLKEEVNEISEEQPRAKVENMRKDEITAVVFKIDSIGGKDVRIGDQDNWNSHMHKNTEGKFQCNQCDYEQVHMSSLIIHIKAVHERLKVSCEVCDFQTGYKRALNDHMRITHEGRLFECKECNFTSRNRSSLSIHTTKHKFKGSMWTNKKSRIQCSKCAYHSASTKQMKKHIKETHL